MGCAAVVTVPTPWVEGELRQIGYEQSGDVMLLTHPAHPVQKLSRYDHDHWTLAAATFGTTIATPAAMGATANKPNTVDPFERTAWYTATVVDDLTGEESMAAPPIGVDNDLSLRGNNNALGVTRDARATRYNYYKGYGQAYGYIGYANQVPSGNPVFVDANIAPDYSDTPPVAQNPFPSANNYPASVTFHQQRAWFGRTFNRPNLLAASQSSQFFNFDIHRPVMDSDAITLGLNARKVNAIQHLVPLKDLMVFTSDAVWKISGDNGAITPASVSVTPQGYRGCANVRPCVVDEVIFYATAKGASIRTLNFEFSIDGYKSNDITVFCPHFFRRVKVVDMAWAEWPMQTLFVVCDDGKVRCLTWQAEQGVWGWSLMDTPGMGGWIQSVCVITEDGEDRPYFVTWRNLPATPSRAARNVRAIERMGSNLWRDESEMNYLDASLRYTGTPTDHLSGLHHLEGQLVQAVVDGGVVKVDPTGQPLRVVGGKLALPKPGADILIGLGYSAWGRTLPFTPQTASGSLRGRPASLGVTTIQVERTRGLAVGLAKDSKLSPMAITVDDEWKEGYTVKARNDRLAPGLLPPLFTGTYDVNIPPGDWTLPSIILRQDDPMPMHVLAVAPEVTAGG